MDKVNIQKGELELLAYLHEHVEGYGEHDRLRAEEVIKAMGVTAADFRKAATFLREFGLVGIVEKPHRSTSSQGVMMGGIWLTGQGENFMRQLEADLAGKLATAPDAEPGTATKITTKVAGWLYDVSKDVIADVLATYVNRVTGITGTTA